MTHCKYVSFEQRSDIITLAAVRMKDRLQGSKSGIGEAIAGEDVLQ